MPELLKHHLCASCPAACSAAEAVQMIYSPHSQALIYTAAVIKLILMGRSIRVESSIADEQLETGREFQRGREVMLDSEGGSVQSIP